MKYTKYIIVGLSCLFLQGCSFEKVQTFFKEQNSWCQNLTYENRQDLLEKKKGAVFFTHSQPQELEFIFSKFDKTYWDKNTRKSIIVSQGALTTSVNGFYILEPGMYIIDYAQTRDTVPKVGFSLLYKTFTKLPPFDFKHKIPRYGYFIVKPGEVKYLGELQFFGKESINIVGLSKKSNLMKDVSSPKEYFWEKHPEFKELPFVEDLLNASFQKAYLKIRREMQQKKLQLPKRRDVAKKPKETRR